MTKLVKEVVLKLVEEALDKTSVNIAERNRKLETESVDTGYHRVLKESSERQKRRCNIIIKGLRESPSEAPEERKIQDGSLIEKIGNQVGLQEKPVKIMRLGICITETHYSSDYSDAEVGIPNYRLYRKDRDANGGGSCIYVHVKHAAQLMGGFCLLDSLGVTLTLDSGDVHLVCIYRSPRSTSDQDRMMREELHQPPSSDTDRVIILGDFNLPNVCWSTGTIRGPTDTSDKKLLNQKDFMDCFTYCGLAWHITDEITRRRMVNDVLQESTLDQVFTSDPYMIKQIALSPPLGKSDHLSLKIELKLYDESEYLASKKFIWSRCNDAKVVQIGQQTNWSYSDEASLCVDTMCNETESKITHITRECVPIFVQKTTKEGIPIAKFTMGMLEASSRTKGKGQSMACF